MVKILFDIGSSGLNNKSGDKGVKNRYSDWLSRFVRSKVTGYSVGTEKEKEDPDDGPHTSMLDFRHIWCCTWEKWTSKYRTYTNKSVLISEDKSTKISTRRCIQEC